MDNQKYIRAIIIILAVISIALLAFYAASQLSSAQDSSMDNIADYGDSYDNSGSETIVSGSDGNYIIADDSTVEMDSIPNDAGIPSASDE